MALARDVRRGDTYEGAFYTTVSGAYQMHQSISNGGALRVRERGTATFISEATDGVSENFDGNGSGQHLFEIDTAAAGYATATGKEFEVVLQPSGVETEVLLGGVDINGTVVDTFSVSKLVSASDLPELRLETTVATVVNTTQVTLTAGSVTDDYYNGRTVILDNNGVRTFHRCTDYIGSTKTLHFTPSAAGVAVGQTVHIKDDPVLNDALDGRKTNLGFASLRESTLVAGSTTTTIRTALAGTDLADFVNGVPLVQFVDGIDAQVIRRVTSVVNNGGTLDFVLDAALPSAPAGGDTIAVFGFVKP